MFSRDFSIITLRLKTITYGKQLYYDKDMKVLCLHFETSRMKCVCTERSRSFDGHDLLTLMIK